VTPAPLGIAANSTTRLYGDANPAFGATYTGLQNGETAAALTGALALTTPAVASSNVGNYAITPSGQSSTNYTISYVNGTLGVTPAPLGVVANSTSKPYGNTVSFAGTEFSSTGLKNSETIGSVSLASAGAVATAGVAGSPYAITPSNATGGTFMPSNYIVGYVNGALIVNPASLTVTASNASKTYGQTPTLTAFTTAGLLNGETVGSVTETSPGTAAAASVAGSPYAITPSSASGGTFTPSNYTISYVNSALTVIPANLTVTASSATKVFGENPTPLLFTTTGLVNGETVGSVTETSPGTAATAAVPGPYAITPSAATGGTFTPSNYTITYVNGALAVTPFPVPPIVVPPVVTPPDESVPVALASETPQFQQPPIAPMQHDLNLTVIGTGVKMPPVLVAATPPAPPPVIVPPEAPPVIVPPEAPPPVYVPPEHRPKPARG
jgi:hypothetical protein